jgi:hypothetical protein
VKGSEDVRQLIKDEQWPYFPCRRNLLVPRSKQGANLAFLYARGNELFSSAAPENVRTGPLLLTRGWVGNMFADEAKVVLIPSRLEDRSCNTPNVSKVLRG